MVTVHQRSSLTSAEGHLGCIFHHPGLSRMIWQHCHPNPNEVVTMSAQSRCCVHYASIHVQEAHEGRSQGGRSPLYADSVSVINISIKRSTDRNAFARPWSWVVSEPQSVVNCKGTPVMLHHDLSWKCKRINLPPNSSTRQRNRYPIIYPILLLGDRSTLRLKLWNSSNTPRYIRTTFTRHSDPSICPRYAQYEIEWHQSTSIDIELLRTPL